jgi:hypothetical protein
MVYRFLVKYRHQIAKGVVRDAMGGEIVGRN